MMTGIPDGPYAFPWISEAHGKMCTGMNLRDYFAAAALPAVIRQCAGDTLLGGDTKEKLFARKSYEIADAMLAERQK